MVYKIYQLYFSLKTYYKIPHMSEFKISNFEASNFEATQSFQQKLVLMIAKALIVTKKFFLPFELQTNFFSQSFQLILILLKGIQLDDSGKKKKENEEKGFLNV